MLERSLMLTGRLRIAGFLIAFLPLSTLAAAQDRDPEWDKLIESGSQALSKWKVEDAEARLRAALERAKSFPAADPRLAKNHDLLGKALELKGDRKGAESEYRATLAILEKIHGKEHPELLALLNRIVRQCRQRGAFVEAIPLLQRQLRIVESGKDPTPVQLISILNPIAKCFRDSGDFAGAGKIYRRILKLNEESKGKEHADLIQNLKDLARVYRADKKPSLAESALLRWMAIQSKIIGSEDLSIAPGLEDLAQVQIAQKKLADAEATYVRWQTLIEKSFGKEHPNYAALRKRIAKVRSLAGDHAGAVDVYLEAEAIYIKSLGPQTLVVAKVARSLAHEYRLLARFRSGRRGGGARHRDLQAETARA